MLLNQYITPTAQKDAGSENLCFSGRYFPAGTGSWENITGQNHLRLNARRSLILAAFALSTYERICDAEDSRIF